MILVFYFFISIYFGRKNPYFYLLFPLALQQGAAAFIDQSLTFGGKRIFSVYDTVFKDVLFVIVVLIGTFLMKIRFPRVGYFGSRLMVFYFIYILTLVLVELLTYKDAGEVLLTARPLIYGPLAYLLWLSIYSAVSRQQYENFLKLTFYLTPISAILYILNSSKIVTIFPRELVYLEVEMVNTNSLRDFQTIPLFLIPVLVICFQSLLMPILKIPKYLVYTNLIVLPIALLFTFTRSLLIMVLMQLIIMVILYSVYKGIYGIRKAGIFIVLLVLFSIPIYLSAQKVFPAQLEYFTGRFLNVSKEGTSEENVDIRLAYVNKTIKITNFTSPAFGAGMNRAFYKELNDVGAWAADSTIPFFLYHTGWVGVVLLYLILIIFSLDSIFQFFKTGDWLVAYLSSNIITLMISSLIMGGLGLNGSVWTFMSLALYTTIKTKLWKESVIFFLYENKSSKVPVIN